MEQCVINEQIIVLKEERKKQRQLAQGLQKVLKKSKSTVKSSKVSIKSAQESIEDQLSGK